MPLDTYDGLCESVARWLHRDDLPLSISDFVWLAECDCQRTIQFRSTDEIAAGTTTDTQQWIDMPDDYQAGGLLRWTSDDTLPSVEVGSYSALNLVQKDLTRQLSGSQIRVGTLHGDRLYIGPTPGTVDYELFYKAGVRHLGARHTTNLILREYPDVLLYGALLQSAPYLGHDERIQTWLEFYKNARSETRISESRARTGHGTLRVRPDVQIY